MLWTDSDVRRDYSHGYKDEYDVFTVNPAQYSPNELLSEPAPAPDIMLCILMGSFATWPGSESGSEAVSGGGRRMLSPLEMGRRRGRSHV
jgi:hypothetical protein